jgi:hypothetical protein
MAIRACKKYRIVWRNLVEILTRWKLRRSPKRFDPTASNDPFAWARFVDALFHPGQEVFKRIYTFHIELHFALANPEDVAMRISEAGHDRATVKIDNPRGMKSFRIVI